MKVEESKLLTIARQVFLDEIAGIQQVKDGLNGEFLKSIMAIFTCKGKIVVSGMGKSGHVAGKIAATLASTGTPAFFVHPAEALHGDLGMIESSDIMLAISYSGESDELLTILPSLKRRNVIIIAMTGNLNSSLAKLSNYRLNIKVDKEACPLNLAPTTSTTVSLVMGDALAISLLTLRGFKPEDFALSHPGGSLGRKLLTTVNDLMHSGDRLPVVYLNTPFKNVVIEISNKGLGLAGVLNEKQQLVGIITDGDLRRVLDGKQNIWQIVAQDVMTKTPKTVKGYDLAIDVINLMEKYKITGFLVTDNDDKLVGAFNLHDLFRAKLI